MKGFPAKFASGVGISVGELVVVFIVVQAVVIAKEEIKKTEVIFFIRKLLLKDKDINLNFTFNIINISKKTKPMKTLTISVLAAFLLLSSCNIKSDNGFPYNVTPKAGTGIIKNKEYKMSFDEIRVAQSISAEVIKSDEEKVVITAPSDILDDILVENEGGNLYIHFKSGINISARNVAAKIFAKDFSSVKASSSASIVIKDKFTQDKMEIEASSSGDITGNLEANEMSIDVSSSGSFTGQIWAVNLKSEVNSSGDIDISGKAKNTDLSASSSGTLNAQKVLAENANIEASSSGDVSISVSNQLNASASSSGDINVTRKGNLNILSNKESSGGSVSIQ